MPKNQIDKYSSFDQIGGGFQNVRKEYMDISKKMVDIVEDNTKDEKKAIEDAFKNYNDKIEKIMKHDKVKKLQEQADTKSKEMSDYLGKAKNEFVKYRQKIMDNHKLSESEKNEKVQELYQVILTKLYSKDEMDKFKNMVGSMVTVMIPQGVGSGGNFQLL